MSDFDKDEFWDSGLNGLDFEEIDEPKREGRARKFFAGSGFYLVLALCVAAVGGVAVWTVNDSMLQKDEGSSAVTTTAATTTRAVAAGHNVATVPDTRTTVRLTATKPTTTATAKAADTYVLPLNNAVLREYGKEPVYWATLETWRVHAATDFAGALGDTVKAAANGTVTDVYENDLWGGCVAIDHHDGTISTYRGVNCTLAVGAAVKLGEPIGVLSEIPCEKDLGPHLHLEMAAGSRVLDPVAVIGVPVKTVEATKSE